MDSLVSETELYQTNHISEHDRNKQLK